MKSRNERSYCHQMELLSKGTDQEGLYRDPKPEMKFSRDG
jgi:hypothetical protein